VTFVHADFRGESFHVYFEFPVFFFFFCVGVSIPVVFPPFPSSRLCLLFEPPTFFSDGSAPFTVSEPRRAVWPVCLLLATKPLVLFDQRQYSNTNYPFFSQARQPPGQAVCFLVGRKAIPHFGISESATAICLFLSTAPTGVPFSQPPFLLL